MDGRGHLLYVTVNRVPSRARQLRSSSQARVFHFYDYPSQRSPSTDWLNLISEGQVNPNGDGGIPPACLQRLSWGSFAIGFTTVGWRAKMNSLLRARRKIAAAALSVCVDAWTDQLQSFSSSWPFRNHKSSLIPICFV